MHQYLIDTEYAASNIINLIMHDERKLEQTNEEYRQLQKDLKFYQQQLSAADMSDDLSPMQLQYEYVRYRERTEGLRKQEEILISKIKELKNLIDAKSFAISSLSSALLQISKQGISIVYKRLECCPDGRVIGKEVLKNIIWQGRNQSMHYEEDNFNPSPHDQAKFFAMGGVIIERGQENVIKFLLDEFKTRWGISLDTPLHSTDMRSKKKNFRFLESYSQEQLNSFYDDLHNVISTYPIVIHACVISRQGYISRFEKIYGQKTWEMMKSSFSILVERSAKYVQKQQGKLMVYYEKAGKVEDKKIVNYFNDIRLNGLPFDKNTSKKYNPCNSEFLSKVLSGIEGKNKSNPVMQVADYCLHPVADVKLHPGNRAYHVFSQNNLIVDYTLNSEETREIGIKYYCY